MKYICAAAALSSTLLVFAMQSANAQANATRLAVTARIATFFQLHVGFQSPSLIVSDADVARGYIDIDAATSFTVTTNTFDPYVVDFRAINPVFSAVLVSGLEAPIQIGPEGGSAVFSAPHGRVTSHWFSYRFVLRKELAPGTYPWPLQISVRAT